VDAYRAWAEIDLDALTHNLSEIRARLEPRVRVMLVVKADAYGHGAVAIAHHALRCGVSAFGVGTSGEALELRKSGVRARILVLGTIVDEEASAALRHGIEIGLHSSDRARSLDELAGRLGERARVHLKIDTGLGRLGVLPSKALELLELVHSSPNLELAGVMTHMAAADGMNDEFTHQQLRVFEDVLGAARARGLLRGWVHAANSSCVFSGIQPQYDCVRPGISAYGVPPGSMRDAQSLRPVMSLHSQIIFLKDVPVGAKVGYSGTWTAPTPTRIATLPIGYNDGLAWRLGNKGHVLVRGKRAPIVGAVSMDMSMIDVTDVPGTALRDEVVALGHQDGALGKDTIQADEVAAACGTIPWEVMTSISRRVPRVYREP